MKLNNSTLLMGYVLAAFVIFITLRGELSAYLKLFRGIGKKPKGKSSGGLLGGILDGVTDALGLPSLPKIDSIPLPPYIDPPQDLLKGERLPTLDQLLDATKKAGY